MSTTTPTTTGTESTTGAADRPGTDGRERSRTTATGRPDRWAAPRQGPREGTSGAAPLTFDPFCARRLRNCIDGANAALPSDD